MESLGNVLRYPMERDDWVQTVLIGGVLVFLAFLLIPIFVVYGYLVRAIRGGLEGATEPPAFEEWGDLLVDGLQAWIIGVVYLLIPAIVGAITVGGSIAALATGDNVAAGVGGMIFGIALTGLLSIVFGYAAVAAVVNFAREEQFGAAFDLDTLKTVLFHREYAIAWLVSVVVLLVAGIVTAVPLVGWILTPFVSFYALVVASTLWADGFSAALGPSETSGEVRGEETVA